MNTIVEDTFFETKLKPQTISETTTETTIHYDADGNKTGSSIHKKVTERYIPADTTAMLFYMKCRMPEKYNDRLNVNVESSNMEVEDLTPLATLLTEGTDTDQNNEVDTDDENKPD